LEKITSEMLPHLPLNSLPLPEEEWDLFPAALALRARAVTPPPNSCVFSHFYSCSDPIMQVLVPFYKGRKLGPESLGHLLKVTQLIGRLWDRSQDQSDSPPHQIALRVQWGALLITSQFQRSLEMVY